MPGVVLDEDQFRITAATLDHGTPCVAFALRETMRVNVLRDALGSLGLPVGRWLNEAKSAVRRGAPDGTIVQVSDDVTIALGDLKRHALPSRSRPDRSLRYRRRLPRH